MNNYLPVYYTMSNIESCVNVVASTILTDSDSFTYQLPPFPHGKPDVMIINQIVVSTEIDTATTVLTGYQLYTDVTHSVVGSVAFPYNFTTGGNSCLTFLSNPHTTIKLDKPIGNTITFQLQQTTGGPVVPASFYISIVFDLIKYTK